MDMKKISYAVVIAAASISTVMAADAGLLAPSAGPSAAGGAPVGAPASAPTAVSGAVSSALPAIGTLVGASLVSVFSYYFN
ncbi:hypothetical protein LINGRAHAP2_LOCUS26055 [Linum grandiflorum]